MSRPIDALITAEELNRQFGIDYADLVDFFAAIPTYENPKGEWQDKVVNGKFRHCCSKCGRYTKALAKAMPPFCQFCGSHNK